MKPSTHPSIFTPSGNAFTQTVEAVPVPRRVPWRERIFLWLVLLAGSSTPLLGAAALFGSEALFAVACLSLAFAGLLLIALVPLVFGRAGK